MQTVICDFKGCGFCSTNGFCLNRLIKINEQGVCKYLLKPGWDRPVEEWEKSTYRKEEKENEEIKAIETDENKSAAAHAKEFLDRSETGKE